MKATRTEVSKGGVPIAVPAVTRTHFNGRLGAPGGTQVIEVI